MRSGVVAVLSSLVLLACETPPPPQHDPAPEALPLGPAGSKPLAFMHVVTRIPAGTLLGTAHWKGSKDVLDEIRSTGGAERDKSFNVAITDLLREHDYTVLDEADAVFDPARAVQVRYQLAGVVHGIEVDYAYERRSAYRGAAQGVGRASIDFELQVHDLVRRETVFKRTYSGFGVDAGMEPNPIVPAVVDAVRRALADPEFVAVAAAGGDAPTGEVAVSPMPRCPEHALALPSQAREAMASIVVVQAGGSLGSGVVVSEEGHVITAAHNLSEDDQVVVRLPAGVQLPAELLRRDAAADVALLLLPGSGYACAALASERELPEGSDLYAVNQGVSSSFDENPSTISRGVLSGYQTHDGRRYLQTDASVNPGSSGGPLLDPSGAVVGIVVEKVFGLGFEGLGFAVPIDEVERALGIAWE